jgi:hypothetical protein
MNTLPVENRRGIDSPSCVPSGRSPDSVSLSRSRHFAARAAPTPVRSSRTSSLRVNWSLSSTWVFHNWRFSHWSHRTCRLVNSLTSRNSSSVFGNPSWPLGVFCVHRSMYCWTVRVVGRWDHFGPPRPSMSSKNQFFFFTRTDTVLLVFHHTDTHT